MHGCILFKIRLLVNVCSFVLLFSLVFVVFLLDILGHVALSGNDMIVILSLLTSFLTAVLGFNQLTKNKKK